MLIFGTNAAGPGCFRTATFDGVNGSIGEIKASTTAPGPFFIVLSHDRRFLYSCETAAGSTNVQGAIGAYAIEGQTLRHLNTVVVDGIETCHLSLDRDGRHLLHASYVDATLGVIALKADGSLGATTAQHRVVTKGSIVADRQGEAHTHSIIVDPTNRFALVADLGSDCIWVFDYDAVAGTLGASPRRIDMEPGDGPRHMVFNPRGDRLFVVGELSNVVQSFDWSEDGRLKPQQRISTLPGDFQAANYAAEILCDPLGQRLYVSNRGHDSIIVYDIAEGRFRRSQIVSSRGAWPRYVAMSPDARWLVAANHRSGNAALFRIDPTSGWLAPQGETVTLPEGFGIAFTA